MQVARPFSSSTYSGERDEMITALFEAFKDGKTIMCLIREKADEKLNLSIIE